MGLMSSIPSTEAAELQLHEPPTLATVGLAPANASLEFAHGGGRTFLTRQKVPYPFHVTKPHYLDVACPDFATLYLQSASGGLYTDDRLTLSIRAGKDVAAHVTSQAATVVHRAPGRGIAVDTNLTVEDDAFLALTTDPYVLFPDTRLALSTQITLGASAVVIIAEGYVAHDFLGQQRSFAQLSTECRIVRADGELLVHEAAEISGDAFFNEASPLHTYRAFGTAMILGAPEFLPNVAAIETSLDDCRVLAGASLLPNGAGLTVRLLADNGGHLATALERVFALGFEAWSGIKPARRRK